MALTLADQATLARLVIAPAAAAAYLCAPMDYQLCFWIAGLLCAFAEITDWLDGRIARARKEVSDFGKLADPFCDVFYRITMFFVFLLPAAGVGYAVPPEHAQEFWRALLYQPIAFDLGDHNGYGLFPVLPVLLMTLREIIAGALRSMAATKGLVLAARMSGKVKAWFQGTCLITAMGFGAILQPSTWQLQFNAIACWLCAILSVYSIIEYIVVNRVVLGQLIERRKLES